MKRESGEPGESSLVIKERPWQTLAFLMLVTSGCLVSYLVLPEHGARWFTASLQGIVTAACFWRLAQGRKPIIEIGDDTVILKGKRYPRRAVLAVSTAYQGFNTDSPCDLVFKMDSGEWIKVDVCLVGKDPRTLVEQVAARISYPPQ